MVKITFKCKQCKKIVTDYPSNKKEFCNIKCRNIYYKGNNNPNYGNKWTKEKKQTLSNKLKGRIPWNKGLTKETDERVKRHAEAISKANSNMSEEGRNNIRIARIKAIFPHTNTTIEIKTQKILKDNGVLFVPHYPFYQGKQGKKNCLANLGILFYLIQNVGKN